MKPLKSIQDVPGSHKNRQSIELEGMYPLLDYTSEKIYLSKIY